MLKYLRYICLIGPRLLWDWVFYLNRYGRHPEKYPLEKRYKRVRGLIRYVLQRMRLDITAEGYEKYINNKKARLLVGNHLSDLDPLLLIALSPDPISFVAKKETYNFPVIGLALRAIDGIFMDRDDMVQSARCLKQCGERLKKGDISYFIFPEGTRNKDPKGPLLEFKAGAYKAAVWGGVEIQEVALYGTFRILHKKPNDKRQPIFISYMKTYEPADNTVEFAAASAERIGEEVYALMKKDEKYYEEGNQNKSLRGLPRPYIHG